VSIFSGREPRKGNTGRKKTQSHRSRASEVKRKSGRPKDRYEKFGGKTETGGFVRKKTPDFSIGGGRRKRRSAREQEKGRQKKDFRKAINVALVDGEKKN